MARRRGSAPSREKTSSQEKSLEAVGGLARQLYAQRFTPIVRTIMFGVAHGLGPAVMDAVGKYLNDDLDALTGGRRIAPREYQTNIIEIDIGCDGLYAGMDATLRFVLSIPLPARFSLNTSPDKQTLNSDLPAIRQTITRVRDDLACLRPLALQLATERELMKWAPVYDFNRASHMLPKTVEHLCIGRTPDLGSGAYTAPKTALALLSTLDPTTGFEFLPKAILRTIPLRALSLAEEKLASLADIGASLPVDPNSGGIVTTFAPSRPVMELMPLLEGTNAVAEAQSVIVRKFETITALEHTSLREKLTAGAAFWNFVAHFTRPSQSN